MTWRFQPGEDLRHAFRRVAEEEIAKARNALAGQAAGRDKAIHEARQSFKRLRALVRLAKSALGDDFAGEIRRWRDAGRLLAGPRDQTVLMQCFDKIVAEHGADLAAESVEALRNRVLGSAATATRGDGVSHVDEVLCILDAAKEEVARLNWPDSAEALVSALRKSQSRLREHWKRACKDPSAEVLHSWRKCVKDQAAQLRLFRLAMPQGMRTLTTEEKATAEHLGEEHDLWLLSERLRCETIPPEIKATQDFLLGVIEERRTVLRRQAFELGGVFSSNKPKAFASSLGDAWDKASARAARKSRRKKPPPASGAAAISQGQ